MNRIALALISLLATTLPGASLWAAELVMDTYFVRQIENNGQLSRQAVDQAFIGDRLLLIIEVQNQGQQAAYQIDLDHDVPGGSHLISFQPSEGAMLTTGTIFQPASFFGSDELSRVRSVRWQIEQIAAGEVVNFEMEFEIVPH